MAFGDAGTHDTDENSEPTVVGSARQADSTATAFETETSGVRVVALGSGKNLRLAL